MAEELPVQAMDAEALAAAREEERVVVIKTTYREPYNILSRTASTIVPVLKEVKGFEVQLSKPSTRTQLVTQEYMVNLLGTPLPNAPVLVGRNGSYTIMRTDENGRLVIEEEPRVGEKTRYHVALAPMPPARTPLSDVFDISAALVLVEVRNKTDRWARFVGRSFIDRLPRLFSIQTPFWVIGLASPLEKAVFVDIVPLLSIIELRIEYGITAWCNTPEQFPPNEKCIEYRRNTWWEFRVHIKGPYTKTVTAELNIDRHLVLYLTTDRVRYEIVRPEGAET